MRSFTLHRPLKFLIAIPMLLAMAAAALPTPEGPKERALRATVNKFMNEYIAAWKKLDVNAAAKVFETYTLATYTAKDSREDKPVSRKDILATYAQQVRSISKLVGFKAQITKLSVSGGKGMVQIRYMMKATGGFNNPDGKEHMFESLRTSDWVWTSTPKGWRGVSSVTAVNQILLDGKPIKGNP
ncbi:MAG: hypothetical protein HZC36_12535 [Armatimonadetes bacterium]|nr:hypothetical protein [Armatimonadota bacterium]